MFWRRTTYALNQTDIRTARHVLHPWEIRHLWRLIGPSSRTFLEAGANDGLTQSNSLLFERYYGWRGILVEPVPELYLQCRVNRPLAIIENVALGPPELEGQTITVRSCGLMSVVKGGMRCKEEEENHVRLGSQISGSYGEVEVRSSTLSQLLNLHGFHRLDVLMLDLEGFELPALRGLDFDRIRPEWILVEARYPDEIADYLKKWYRSVDQVGTMDVLYKLK